MSDQAPAAASAPPPPFTVRDATPADHPAIVALAGAALGWRPGEPNEALFRWKHLDNPFGPSPMWVAEEDGRLVGFRTFLRWRFTVPGGPAVEAVRAVDTATHPAHRGRGVFRALTLHAVDAERARGTGFVFNTPNDQSRPGYLRMGWQVVGEIPIAVALRGPGSLLRVARARVAAGKWSLPTAVGDDPVAVLDDTDALADLLSSQPPGSGLRTARTPAFLRWRYAQGPLAYRALTAVDGDVGSGVALFRLRPRGAAVEATVCDVLVPGGDPRTARRLLARILDDARPDYLIRVQRAPLAGRFVRLPGQGPLLTWRALDRPDDTDHPLPAAWDLCLGDVELF